MLQTAMPSAWPGQPLSSAECSCHQGAAWACKRMVVHACRRCHWACRQRKRAAVINLDQTALASTRSEAAPGSCRTGLRPPNDDLGPHLASATTRRTARLVSLAGLGTPCSNCWVWHRSIGATSPREAALMPPLASDDQACQASAPGSRSTASPQASREPAIKG